MGELQRAFSAQIDQFQSQLERTLERFPALERTLAKARSTKTARFLSDKVGKSKKHIELLAKDFPRDFKSVKPYLSVQRKNLKTWGRDLSSKVKVHRGKVKSKVKTKRPRTA